MFKNSLLILLGACSFGVLSTFVKIAYENGYTLGEVTGVQAFFGMLGLWILHGLSRTFGVSKKKNHVKHPSWVLVVAGFSTGIVSILYYKCVQLLPASIAIVLLMQFVWISILLDYLVFKSKPSRFQIISIFFILLGTLFAAGLFNEQYISLSFKGVFFGLLAALSYALFITINGRVGNDYPATKKSALMVTGACIIIFVVFPPAFLVNGILFKGLWFWGVVLSLFGTIIPPLFFAEGIPHVGVSLSSILSAIELPVAVGMSYFVLSERVSMLQCLGVFIILSAIVFSNLKQRKAT